MLGLMQLLPWTTCLKVLTRHEEFFTSLEEFEDFVGILAKSLSVLVLLLLLWNASTDLMN